MPSGYNLPENVATGAAGHVQQHNMIHDIVNKFDKDVAPESGDVLVWDAETSLYVAKSPEFLAGITAGQLADFTDSTRGVVGAMVEDAGGSFDAASGTIAFPGGGGGITDLDATLQVDPQT